MPATVFPPSVQGTGTMKVSWLPAIAIPTAPTLTELNATTTFDMTSYFRADQFQIDVAQDRNDDTRLSDVSKREGFALPNFTINDGIRYIHDPQAAGSSTTNYAYQEFYEGRTGYLVLRYGSKVLLSGAAYAAAQRIGGIYSVSFGVQHKLVPVGDNSVHTIQQPITLTRIAADFTVA